MSSSNMLFYLDVCPHVPPDFHSPSSFQLLINHEAVKWWLLVRFWSSSTTRYHPPLNIDREYTHSQTYEQCFKSGATSFEGGLTKTKTSKTKTSISAAPSPSSHQVCESEDKIHFCPGLQDLSNVPIKILFYTFIIRQHHVCTEGTFAGSLVVWISCWFLDWRTLTALSWEVFTLFECFSFKGS